RCAGRGPEPPHHRSVTAADGLFCPGQSTAGAFGQGTPRCITETGMAGGDLTDGAPHAAREGGGLLHPRDRERHGESRGRPPRGRAPSLTGIAQIVPTPSPPRRGTLAPRPMRY